MATLRTNYKDDILAAAMDGKRQYQMINNPNGTVSFVDVTDYTQNGDVFSAGDINNTNNRILDNTSRVQRDITNDISQLTTAIAEQNLEKYGYKIGDYFVGANRYTYWLADLDPYYAGFTKANRNVFDTHHIGILVDTHTNSKWNEASTNNSYYDISVLHSYLSGTVLDNVKSDITQLIGTWSDHLLSMSYYGSGYIYSLILAPSEVHFVGLYRDVQISGSYYKNDNSYLYDVLDGSGAFRQLEIFRKRHYNVMFGENDIWTCSGLMKVKISDSSITRRGVFMTKDGQGFSDMSPSFTALAVGLILLK